MDSGRNNLIDVFTKERFFIVPSYQRSYSWEEKQQKDFFEDFKNNYNNTNYYYGTILLQKDKSDENKFEIVDGQQRITTLTIFVKCLIKELRKRKDIKENSEILKDIDDDDIDDLEKKFIESKGRKKLKLQEQDTQFFWDFILSDNNDFGVETPAQRRLSQANKNFEKWMTKSDTETLKLMYHNIMTTKILIYIIENRKEASLLFETTNDRGKNLTTLEKIKSFLMYKVSSLLKEPDELLFYIENSFNKIYRTLETIENVNVDEDSILQYNFIANEKWNNENGKKEYQHYIENLKKKLEELGKDKTNNFESFSKYVKKYVFNINETYSNMSNILTKSVEEFKDLKVLGRLASFYPLLLKTYKNDASEEKIYFKKVCRLCEIFSFRTFVIFKYASNKFQTKFYELARDFENDSSNKEIEKEYDTLFAKITSLIKVLGNDDKFITELRCNDFFNKYSAMDKVYFFWKYENYLRENKKPVYTPMSHEDLIRHKDARKNLTIEHIVAQGNVNEQQRIIKISDIIKLGDDESKLKFQEMYLHSIGNLTLDSHSANASKSSKDTSEKNNEYFKQAPYMCQNELERFLDNKVITNYNGKQLKSWTLDSIEKRANAICEFARKTWCEPLNQYPTLDMYINDDEED